MKQILITDHFYNRLKTIADEQDERIEVMHTPSRGTGARGSIDGRSGLGNDSDLALAAAAQTGDHAEYRRIREEQKAAME